MEKAKASIFPKAYVLPKPQLRLLDQVREVMRVKHYSLRTEQTYVQWIRRNIFFHGKRHPRDVGPAAISPFLSDLAVRLKVSAATQNQALNALVLLYDQVLHVELGELPETVRARPSRRVPVVLTGEEVGRLFAAMDGTFLLMAKLLYGSGMRLMEVVRLRVKDVDFERNQIAVRDGKGAAAVQ